jgi:hypothetical protein
MKQHLLRLSLSPIAFGICLLAASTVAHAQATTVTTNLEFPLDNLQQTNPCTGELITFSGSAHLVIHATSTPSGNFNNVVHQNFQDVAGLGADSGATFHFQFPDTLQFTSAAGAETTLALNLRIVGPGPGNNFMVREVSHVTINANGQATATFDHFTASCQ